LRLSLLRSPAFSAHPVLDNEILPKDRFTPRIDQGERIFRFWVNGGPITERLNSIGNEALAHNEKPFVLSFFPNGQGNVPKPLAVLNKPVIEIAAIKKAHSNNDWIVRLFNSSAKKQTAQLKLPALGLQQTLAFGPSEIKTLRVHRNKQISEVNLIEEKR
jgi:alpha-mannosidase